MPAHAYKTPDGTEHVSLPRAAYQDLIDARDHAITMRNIAAGAPVLTESELDAFSPPPLPWPSGAPAPPSRKPPSPEKPA